MSVRVRVYMTFDMSVLGMRLDAIPGLFGRIRIRVRLGWSGGGGGKNSEAVHWNTFLVGTI